MVDRTAPERIWLTADEDCRPFVTKGPLASPPRTEYIRADLGSFYQEKDIDALQNRIKELESGRDKWSRLYDKVVEQDAEQYKHLVTAKEKLREVLQKENRYR
jgi:hypothetical protein